MKTGNKGIWERRREIEQATGKPVEIYSAYPSIGRGSVFHNMVTHEEVEKRFASSLKVSVKQRFKQWFCQKVLRHV